MTIETKTCIRAKEKPWYLTGRPTLSVWDRLRFLCGVPLHCTFFTPDGECHAACSMQYRVSRVWPSDTDLEVRS